MKKRVLKDVTANRYFKSNSSGWSGDWLKANAIVWKASVEKAAHYSTSKRDDEALDGILIAFAKLFPDHVFEVQTYEMVRVGVRV